MLLPDRPLSILIVLWGLVSSCGKDNLTLFDVYGRILNQMVKYYLSLDGTFSALAHPIRREILKRLSRGEAAITELAAPFNISLQAVLKHIRILEKSGLVSSIKTGRVHLCRLNAAPIQEAAEWLAFYENYWNNKLDSLGEFLEENNDSNSV